MLRIPAWTTHIERTFAGDQDVSLSIKKKCCLVCPFCYKIVVINLHFQVGKFILVAVLNRSSKEHLLYIERHSFYNFSEPNF